MPRITCLAGALFLLVLLGGCSTYVEDFQYVPRPAVANLPPTPPQTYPPVTAFASVIGIHYPDSRLGIPLSVQVQLRIENNGPDTVVFQPQTVQLLDGDLMDFPPPILQPAWPVTLAPQQSASFTCFFPFPRGRSYDNTDMNSLQLRWAVQVAGKNAGLGVSFSRVIPVYYHPYWDYPPPYPYPWFGVGGTVVIHAR